MGSQPGLSLGSAHLPDNRSYPVPQRAFQHLVGILRDPDDVTMNKKTAIASSRLKTGLNPKN